VGNWLSPGESSQAFTWTSALGGAAVDASLPYSTANAVNDLGQIVGTFANGGPATAYVWSAVIGRRALFTGGDGGSTALDINNAGLAVGARRDSSGLPTALAWTHSSGERTLPGTEAHGG